MDKPRELGSRGGEVGTSISSSELSVPLVRITIWRVPLASVSRELAFVMLTLRITERWLRADRDQKADQDSHRYSGVIVGT